MRKSFWFLSLFLSVVLFSVSQGWTQPKLWTKPPTITHSFAIERGIYGYIWKIYIEAEDPDGDMLRIASTVEQTGYGRYPTDWIVLRPQYRKHFKGYIQWNTFSSRTSFLREWTQVALKVSIVDKAGNESNTVIFPFTFESGVKGQYRYKLPDPFNKGDLPRLGYVHIDLFEPTVMGNGGSSNR